MLAPIHHPLSIQVAALQPAVAPSIRPANAPISVAPIAEPALIAKTKQVESLFFKPTGSLIERTTPFGKIRALFGRVGIPENAEPIAALRGIISGGRGSSVETQAIYQESWELLLGLTLSALRAGHTARGLDAVRVLQENGVPQPQSAQAIECALLGLKQTHRVERGGLQLHEACIKAFLKLCKSNATIPDGEALINALYAFSQTRLEECSAPAQKAFTQTLSLLVKDPQLTESQQTYLKGILRGL